jgi:hypothetical protein
MTGDTPELRFFVLLMESIITCPLGKIFCIPCVKGNAEQKISPRATLSGAKLELKRIIFCGSILFYKCTTII